MASMTPAEQPALSPLSQEQLYEKYGADWDTVARLHAEFEDEWEIVRHPGGLRMWTALHKEDRSERYVGAPTPGQLLAKLRDIRDTGTPREEETR
jgi:hypothetical protein